MPLPNKSYSIDIVSEDHTFVLSRAILLYGNKHPGRAWATIHPVTIKPNGAADIGVGRAVTHDDIQEWTEAIRKEPPLDFLPDNILARTADAIVWRVPAGVHETLFDLPGKLSKDSKVLSGKISRTLPYPSLMLAATRRTLQIFALSDDVRPGPETLLCHAPTLNTYEDGAMCWGSVAMPSLDAPNATKLFERAVFDTWNLHPNSDWTDLVALWDDIAASGATVFPTERLLPVKLPFQTRPFTLNDLIVNLRRAS